MIGSYSSESIHAQIFNRLLNVIPDLLTIDDVGMSEVNGMLPLHFDVVSRTTTKLTIMLGHSRAESGGVVIDPEMTVAVYIDRSMAEALTYRMRTCPTRSTRRTRATSTFWQSAC